LNNNNNNNLNSGFWWENLRERGQVEDLGIDGRIKLK
jgi:hypothetical protein